MTRVFTGRGLRVLALAAVAWSAAAGWAQAGTWYRAETDRFIVYGESTAEKVAAYARKLQTFDAILRLYHPESAARTPQTKVQVVLLASRNDLRRVRPGLNPSIAGFYVPNNEGVFALATLEDSEEADDTLLHEYAHHFMLENFPAAYPAWFVEGFAEYFMTVQIKPSEVRIGDYNENRVAWIVNSQWLPLQDVLTKPVGAFRGDDRVLFYAQAWLFTHYLRSDPARAKQLNAALRAIAQGEAPAKAFEVATGKTMAQLTAELRRYRRLPVTVLRDPKMQLGETKVTQMPPSTDDLFLDDIRLLLSAAKAAGPEEQGFLTQLRRKAAKWPDDKAAKMTLARAEFVMGDVATGEKLMKELLATAPDDREVIELAGMGEFLAGEREPKERAARFRAARSYFMKSYKMNDQDFRPLHFYVRTRVVEANFPSERDIEAAIEARQLAPSVPELSMHAGSLLIAKGRKEEARKVLTALLNDPHNRARAAAVKALLDGKTETEAEKVADSDDDKGIEKQVP